ncbi:hypothetical protein HD554DRAFT_1981612, partial [Boletus coccyginus]
HVRIISETSYGDLEKIFVVAIPPESFFKTLISKTLALVLIMPWKTEGNLASEENVYLISHKASIITDVHNLKAVVGLIQTREKWGIID